MTFSELSVGQKAEFIKAFSPADVEDFSRISGDKNPVHLNDDYAAATTFGKRIVHGILVTGLISAILANQLPGEGTIYLGQEISFLAPVYLNEEIRAEVEITELRADKKIVKLSTNCFRLDGTQVIRGNATVKLFA
jgi:acyl dehydratase